MSLANPSFSLPESEQLLPIHNDMPGTPLTPQVMHQSGAAEVMTSVVEGAHDTIDRLAERTSPKLEQLEHGLVETSEALRGKAEQWRATGEEWTESLRGSVRDHPLAALAAAVAVGAAIVRLARLGR